MLSATGVNHVNARKRIAVVLFNLGGPDSPEAVEPFLFNLFNDRAIINLPNPFRFFLAKLLSSRRAPLAQDIYAKIGGRSPILPLTEQQATLLQESLAETLEAEVKTFIAMRYWHPMTAETVQAVKSFAPDEVIALPLYPQYSTTTTASSFKSWKKEAAKAGLQARTHYPCCYPVEDNFIAAHVELIAPVYQETMAHGRPRILFSAHGLPEKVIQTGDPYQSQVEMTSAKVLARLEAAFNTEIDAVVCYQSKVGPLKWIGPSTDEEIRRAGAENVPLVVVPIAFVSEHSETLVELDMEYAHLATEAGVPYYARVSALGDSPLFIKSLSSICQNVIAGKSRPRMCDEKWEQCPCKNS